LAWPAGALLLTAAGAAPSRAPHEYVVDTASSRAADTNPGTSDQPLKTISRAAELAQPGETVRVRPGTYRESVHLRRGGVPGRPLTFLADPPGQAVVTGADPLRGWQRLAGA